MRSRLKLSAAAQEKLHHVGVAFLRSNEQRREAQCVTERDVCAAAEQQGHPGRSRSGAQVAGIQPELAEKLVRRAGSLDIGRQAKEGNSPQGGHEGVLQGNLKEPRRQALHAAELQFGQQEPGQAKEIADFCFNTYGVKFPMFSKTSVVGKEANPLFASLTKATGKAPGWNFHKYLVDRQGNPVASFSSNVTPTSSQLVAGIEKALTQK